MMSGWGMGNFENDTAADQLIALKECLIKEISDIMNADFAIGGPNEGPAKVMTNLEILICLGQALYKESGSDLHHFQAPPILPNAEDISRWKEIYLDAWDRWDRELVHIYLTPHYIAERRNVIASTFDRVTELLKQREARGLAAASRFFAQQPPKA
jgi:hypothetical protein